MFEDWENFYILIGSAAGALIGLLFVVVTLAGNMGLDRTRMLWAADLFMTPTVVMFCTVLVTGALATAPRLKPAVQLGVIGAMAVAGMAYGAWISLAIRRRRDQTAHWSDLWYYGVAPGAAFAGLGLADALYGAVPGLFAYGVGAMMIAMLLLGIRNAWDLITWMAPGPPPSPPSEQSPGSGA
jgi:hypothetical protein